jgi:hypothetical protein
VILRCGHRAREADVIVLAGKRRAWCRRCSKYESTRPTKKTVEEAEARAHLDHDEDLLGRAWPDTPAA